MLDSESFCGVMLDCNTSHFDTLPSDVSDKLSAVAPHLKIVHPEFFQLFTAVIQEVLKAHLFQRLMLPLGDLASLLWSFLAAGSMLCGSGFHCTAISATRKMGTRAKPDWVGGLQLESWSFGFSGDGIQ